MSIAFITDYNENNRIYFDYLPTPQVCPKYEVTTSRQRLLNTRDEYGNVVPGQYHTYLGGTHVTGSSIIITVLSMSRADYADIVTLLTTYKGQAQFSPDNGAIYYIGVITKVDLNPIAGTNILAGTIEMNLTTEIYAP